MSAELEYALVQDTRTKQWAGCFWARGFEGQPESKQNTRWQSAWFSTEEEAIEWQCATLEFLQDRYKDYDMQIIPWAGANA